MITAPLLLAAYVHDLDPFVFRITPTIGPRWYGLAYVMGFALGWALLRYASNRGRLRIPAPHVGDMMVLLMLAVLAGGRLGYAVFYRPEILWTFMPSPPWWELLAIHEGGMSSHGGMIGVALACVVIARRERVPALHVMDAVAAATPVGLFFGRLANFINGELLGRIVAGPGRPAPWWSVKYPQELLTKQRPGLDPEQVDRLEAIAERFALPGEAFNDAAGRVISLIQHGDTALKAELAPLLAARYPSQLIQAFAEGIVLFVIVWAVWLRSKRSGMTAAAFLIAYGLLRIATEHFRLPDDHLVTPLIMGLSRGQWLSVGLVIAGAALLWFVRAQGGRAETPGDAGAAGRSGPT